MAETSQKFELELNDPVLLFVTFGGFVYCASDGKVGCLLTGWVGDCETNEQKATRQGV
jgi:hypothetical protein